MNKEFNKNYLKTGREFLAMHYRHEAARLRIASEQLWQERDGLIDQRIACKDADQRQALQAEIDEIAEAARIVETYASLNYNSQVVVGEPSVSIS